MLRGMRPRDNRRQHTSRPPAAALRVTVFLDKTKRGLVIGSQGATVKRMQQVSGAQIRTPRRGVEGPTEVTGPDANSVLHACCLLARHTSASSSCECSLVGLDYTLKATLFPTSQACLFPSRPSCTRAHPRPLPT